MGRSLLDAVIVGAGFSGIAAAIHLKKLGMNEIVIVEREDDVGGTWHVNRYPGIAVDIMSATYQYWFEPNPHWSRLYARGGEIKDYADHVAAKYDVRRHVRFRTEVASAAWDADTKSWRVHLSDGQDLIARFLISATGFLSQRRYPDIAGLDTFGGEIVHTTQWQHKRPDLIGRRVGVIGTGATSVQMLPELAKQVDHLTVYQRTPIWVTPKLDIAIPGYMRRIFAKYRYTQRCLRACTDALYRFMLFVVLNYPRYRALVKLNEWACRAQLFLIIRDSRLRAQLTPDYSFGCKRPTYSNDYYRMFTSADVRLDTSGIDRIEPDGIRSCDGTKTVIDTLVLSTGFDVWEHNFPAFETIGRHGIDLSTWWRERRYESYEGVTVPNFPNYFAMTCPWACTGLSFFDTIHQQMVHMERLFGEVLRQGSMTFEVTETASQRFIARMRPRMEATLLYHANCATSRTFYLNDEGDSAWFRPTSTRTALREQAKFPLTDYKFS